MQCFVNTERYKSTKITPNPTCGAGGKCVSAPTAARYWVQRHRCRHRCRHAGKNNLTPNPLSMRAGSAFLHQLRREIASGGSPALNPVVRAGRKVCAPADPSANLGPASRKIQKLTLNPVVGAGRQCISAPTAARYWVQRHRWSVRQELNLRTYGRSVLLYPLSYGQIRAA